MLLSMASDYGLGNFLLREAGARPKDAVNIVRRGLVLKVWTTALSVLIAALVFVVLRPASETALVNCAVLIGVFSAAFADLGFVVVRAKGRFDVEARSVVLSNFFMLPFVVGVAAATSDVFASALAFALSRLFYLAVAAVMLRKWLLGPGAWPSDWRGLRRMVREASGFAADGILTNLSVQIDIVAVSLVLDPVSIGLYQVGARLVQGIAPFAAVLATVYLPRLARARNDAGLYLHLQNLVNIEFALLAFGAGAFFLFAAPVLSVAVFGERYAGLASLWPGFAAFALGRVWLAGLGVQLFASNKIYMRVIAQIVSLAVMGLGAVPVLTHYGLSAAPWLLAVSTLVGFPLYGHALWGFGLRFFILFGLSIGLIAVLTISTVS